MKQIWIVLDLLIKVQYGIWIQNITSTSSSNFKKIYQTLEVVRHSINDSIPDSFIISMSNQDINYADWATYAVDRKFKLLKNSVFPTNSDNFFIESSANSVTLTKQVSLKKFDKKSLCKSIASLFVYVCIR